MNLQIGRDTPLNGSECCNRLFSSVPFLTAQVTTFGTLNIFPSWVMAAIFAYHVQGTCFRAEPSFPVSTPGLTIVTQHDNLL